jgi:hypothetical protein
MLVSAAAGRTHELQLQPGFAPIRSVVANIGPLVDRWSTYKASNAIPNCGSTARGVWHEHFASSVTTSKSLP